MLVLQQIDHWVAAVKEMETVIQDLIDHHERFVVTDHDMRVLQEIKHQARLSSSMGDNASARVMALTTEMVQEQEQEQGALHCERA
eukprot:22676-Eustigmatos_ZCMA.PRE.1